MSEIAIMFNSYMDRIKSAQDKISEGMEVNNRFIIAASDLVEKIKSGQLSVRLHDKANNPSLNVFRDLINNMLQQISDVFDEINLKLQKLELGNLDERVQGNYQGDFAEIKSVVNTMAEKLQGVIEETGSSLGRLADGYMKTRFQRVL